MIKTLALLPILLFVSACANQAPPAHPDLSGVWIIAGSPDLPGTPSYTPEAMAKWNDRKQNLAADDPATYCLPNGVVRITNLPYKVVQTDDLVVILSEGNTHSFRRLFLDGRPHDLEVEPESWTGNSIGKWEGDTLVIDTIGFNDRTWLDSTGKPHSNQLHVTERYSRPDADHLKIDYRLEDPGDFTEPYEFSRTFNLAKDREIEEQFCTDRNILAPTAAPSKQ